MTCVQPCVRQFMVASTTPKQWKSGTHTHNIICHCGKIGCVETEVSGRALKRKLTENILAGKPSILSVKVLKQKEELTLEDIMDAIAKEDVSEFALYAETPSYRANNINEGWKFLVWAGEG